MRCNDNPKPIAQEACWILVCAAVLAWQLFVPGFIGIADNADFFKVSGPFCLGAADSNAALFFQSDYLRGGQFCLDQHLPMAEKTLVWLASSVEQRLGVPGRFDIRWLGALHALIFLWFYFLLIRLLRPLNLILRASLSLAGLWIFADVGLTSFFNSFYSDTAAILGALVASAAGLVLLQRKVPPLGLVAAYSLAALLLTLSKAQTHGRTARCCLGGPSGTAGSKQTCQGHRLLFFPWFCCWGQLTF